MNPNYLIPIETPIPMRGARSEGGEFCEYCYEPRGDKRACCGENHFVTGAMLKHANPELYAELVEKGEVAS
jgi:hypothetical protein